MVQIKPRITEYLFCVLSLYIPHGSDKTEAAPHHDGDSAYFISHMVQIKRENAYESPAIDVHFISHMVQIKQKLHVFAHRGRASFISHMVQIKLSWCSFPYVCRQLYIPHGSDKTAFVASLFTNSYAFISHMVQIKPTRRQR